MSRFKLLYFVIFIINLCRLNAQISDKRLCVDEECKVPISLARTLLRYSSPDSRILSFAPNVEITIYSKSAGSRAELWGGEINGKRGYIPKNLVRETKILNKPTLLVDTEFSNVTETKQVPSQVEPNKVQEPYEVVDGTTLYFNPQDAINPTSTESPVQSTALPATESNKITPEVAPSQEPPKGGTETEPDKIISPESVSSQPSPKNETSDVDSSVTEKPDALLKEEVVLDPPQTQESSTVDSGATETQKSSQNELPEVQSNVENDQGIPPKNEASPEEEEPSVDDENDDDDEDDEDNSVDIDEDNDDEDDEEEENEEKEVSPEIGNKSEIMIETSTEIKTESIKTDDKLDVTASTIKEEESVIKEQSEPEVAIENPVEIPDTGNINSADNQTNQQEENRKNESIESVEETVSKPTEIPDSGNINSADNQTTQQEEITKNETIENVEETVIQNSSEDTTSSEIKEAEVTTITPEIEVPQPFDDGLLEVTPNPVESVSEVTPNLMDSVSEEAKIRVPTMPPLGLFSNLNDVSSEKIDKLEAEELSKEEIVSDIDESNKIEEIIEPLEKKFDDMEVNDVTSTEDNEDTAEKDMYDRTENNADDSTDSGLLSGFLSLFGGGSEEKTNDKTEELTSDHAPDLGEKHGENDNLISKDNTEQFCDAISCQKTEVDEPMARAETMDLFNFNSDVFLYLVTTAISVIVFLFGYIAFDKSKREGPLVAKINNLEKELLIVLKENQILQDKIAGDSGYDTNDRVSSEVVENLKQDIIDITSIKNALEEQVQSLEKELENSTEVGMELNRMLSEILSSESGSDVLKANVEHLQRQLVEQQTTVNSVNETLAITNTENHELKLELELSNKKVVDLQAELDKLLLNVLKIEEEKDTQQTSLENEIVIYKQKCEETSRQLKIKEEEYSIEMKQLKNRLCQTERDLELKVKEQDVITETVKQLKAVKTNDGPTLQSLLDVSGIKAELQLLKAENQKFSEKLQQEEEAKLTYEKRAQTAIEEVQRLKHRYDEADKLKVEMETKLEVLSSYFKDREAQLQKEIAKHESLWVEKQGEATSTTERIKFMQEQLQNYKAQTESLKQEIMSQEVELKSQISVLEKKAHENWVSARQAERKLEEAKQEAAQLRHRLTLRERAIQEDKNQHRFQSPIEQNGDMPVSPLESPASPPLLYGARDHITKSPPIPGLPPFLPPPPGVPFMPPPLHGVPPFIPPPPTMFPGDHRPPPLGRMSSPPLNSRYSPSSRGYSPYDSSPSDSEYGTSPPQRRGYSPFNNRGEDRRDYKRPPPGRSNGRNIMKDGGSSGSGNSNESLEKINRQQSKV